MEPQTAINSPVLQKTIIFQLINKSGSISLSSVQLSINPEKDLSVPPDLKHLSSYHLEMISHHAVVSTQSYPSILLFTNTHQLSITQRPSMFETHTH